MNVHTTADNVQFTEEDIKRWGQEAESGFTGWKFGKPVAGRPVSVGTDARPFTLCLDAERRMKLNKIAQEKHTTPSQLMRNLIDAL
ncbi:MAG: CopG family transcriptional regulator [Leucobacter sp.]